MNYKIQALKLDNNTLTTHPVKKIEKINKEIAFVFHIFYADLWYSELKPYIDKIKLPYDLYMTVPESMPDKEIINILKSHPQIHLYQTENRGRDVLPFLHILNLIGTHTYKYICKIHTKKSAGRELGTVWRKLLYYDLIGSNKIVVENLELFEYNDKIAMITGKNTILNAQEFYLENRKQTDKLKKQCNLSINDEYYFAGGTMFWVQPEILTPLLQLFQQNKLLFEKEAGQMDNTLAHAIERFLGMLCYAQNKVMAKSVSEYTQLDEKTLEQVANLVLSQTYAGKDVFLELKANIAHQNTIINDKTKEIVNAHKGMEHRDKEIMKAHKSLQEAITLLQTKDHALELKDKQIEFLNSLTLKRRIKQQIKKIIPNKILTFFGFSTYSPLVLPQKNVN